MEKLDWIERAAIENLTRRVQNADAIHKEANTLLALLLSRGGAALYFAAKETALTSVALGVSFRLFAVAIAVTWNCLMFSDYRAVWNEPKNLNNTQYELDLLREYELENIQERIEQATRLNHAKSEWLNRCILAACLTPVVAFTVWAV
jgi:hypothetical protein